MDAELFKSLVNNCGGKYLGFVPRSYLPLLYRAAEVFVFPSFHEGFGLPVAEAAACGVPLIISNIPPFTELWKDASIFMNPYDIRAISDALLSISDLNLEKLSSLAYERAKPLNWTRATREMIEYWKMVSSLSSL